MLFYMTVRDPGALLSAESGNVSASCPLPAALWPSLSNKQVKGAFLFSCASHARGCLAPLWLTYVPSLPYAIILPISCPGKRPLGWIVIWLLAETEAAPQHQYNMDAKKGQHLSKREGYIFFFCMLCILMSLYPGFRRLLPPAFWMLGSEDLRDGNNACKAEKC